MAGACRLFSGAHKAIFARLDLSEVTPGVSGRVCLPPLRLIRLFGSPSTLPCPRLDVGSTVRKLGVGVVMNVTKTRGS